jgi:hypothetical protein
MQDWNWRDWTMVKKKSKNGKDAKLTLLKSTKQNENQQIKRWKLKPTIEMKRNV